MCFSKIESLFFEKYKKWGLKGFEKKKNSKKFWVLKGKKILNTFFEKIKIKTKEALKQNLGKEKL